MPSVHSNHARALYVIVRSLTRAAFLLSFTLGFVLAQSTCIPFPPQPVPFASVYYVTPANGAGDHLVVGALAGGPSGLSAIFAKIPLPSVPNQTFCDSQVQLAPRQFYPNVYVPTAAERAGIYSAFAGLLIDPETNQPFPDGVIPAGRVGSVFGWRIGPAQAPQAVRSWNPTGSMTEPRAEHAAVLLPSGKILIVGDENTAEVYDPATGTFAPVGTTVFGHGNDATATLLSDGRVLIAGGRNAPSAAELFDPVTGQFVATGASVEPHGFYHTATLLNDGRVLVVGGLAAAGGSRGQDGSSGAEVYDPKTGTFAMAAPMAANRCKHTATLLTDGRILVAGGQSGVSSPVQFDSAEIYDPSTGQFTFTAPMHIGRDGHYAVLLSNGKVLIGGGDGAAAFSAEVFDPGTSSFAITGSMSTGRVLASAVLLSSGQVLVPGGYANFPAGTNAAELYSPATGTFTTTGSMGTPRGNATVALLLDGRVLVTGGVCCGSALSSAELYTPVIQGLVTSQTGITVRVAQGANNVPAQSIVVLSNTDTIPFTVSTHTFTGGNWLTASPSSGISGPGAPFSLSINADLTGLTAQDYYGTVTLSPTDHAHPSVSISVVLSIVPAGAAAPPSVAPSGLVFLGVPGTNPTPQAFSISNLTSKTISFTASGAATPNWFDFNPKSGAIGPGQTATITVTPASSALKAGVYPASIQVTFQDGTTQIVDLLLVISSTAGTFTKHEAEPRTTACTPTKLLPVFTTIGTGFTTPVAWPTAIAVQVVDDCSNLINKGGVTVSFNNGDPPLALLGIGGGTWSGTWVPVNNITSQFAVRADAQSQQLSGSVQVTGQVASNPKVPIVSAVVSSGDYTSSPAEGLLVSIFGTALADGKAGATGLPLPQQLGSTSVVVSGVELPLLYVSDGQVNVMVPYDLAINAPHQMIVLRGNAISVPAPIAVFDSEPAILATGGNGSGQGVILRVDQQGNSALANAASPASAGDVLVIYCVGLGSVSPRVMAGDPAPGGPPAKTTSKVTVTIGGQPAVVSFAGLSPGSTGLYQVNVTVPSGIAPGDKVPVTVSVAGKSSSGSIYMAIK